MTYYEVRNVYTHELIAGAFASAKAAWGFAAAQHYPASSVYVVRENDSYGRRY